MGKQQDREKIVQKIKVAADLYRKLPFCKIPEELKQLIYPEGMRIIDSRIM